MFKVGDKVTSSKFKGVGEVIAIIEGDKYPLQVRNGDYIPYSFTLDGREYAEEPINLFKVKKKSIMNKVTVTIKVSKDFEITQAERQLILDLKADRKVSAIKFILKQYDLSLLEAKLICDKLWEINQ